MARPINWGGGTLGGEEEGGAVTFFQESESFIMIIVCLVGLADAVNVKNFKSLLKQLRPGVIIINQIVEATACTLKC